MMTTLMAMKDAMPLGTFVKQMVDQTGLMEQYQKEDSDEARSRVENIQEFLGAVEEFDRQTENATLEDYLENVALVTELDQAEEEKQYVTLMTLHSAKGLEFPNVFITGMEEGIFPSGRSLMDEQRMEEERRLCYGWELPGQKNVCSCPGPASACFIIRSTIMLPAVSFRKFPAVCWKMNGKPNGNKPSRVIPYPSRNPIPADTG